jgi:threonine synthase
MRFVGLTDPTDVVSFQEALESGVPQDARSVYVPEYIPQLSPEEIHGLVGANPIDIGKTMLRPYVKEEISENDLDGIVRQATTFDIPVVDVGDRKVLEVFHGPTGAFKDVAAQYIGAFMSHFYQETGRRSIFLVATSGDTGGAIARGLADKPGIDVVVGYPKGRVSNLQQEQLRRVASNIHSLEVDGSFDDCLRLTEEALDDEGLQEHVNLTTANSINIGRWLPQITYHAGIFSQHGDRNARIVTPTGNEGNLGAGLLARAMGVPSRGYVAATNTNDSLVRYLESGLYQPMDTSIPTHSNAMDVANPKNWPRLQWLFDSDIDQMRGVLSARRVTDDETVKVMREVYDETGYILDPHTAVGWAASQPGDVIVATASPLKFAEEIEELTGIEVDNSAELSVLRETPERYAKMPNDPETYKDYIRNLQREPAAA